MERKTNYTLPLTKQLVNVYNRYFKFDEHALTTTQMPLNKIRYNLHLSHAKSQPITITLENGREVSGIIQTKLDTNRYVVKIVKTNIYQIIGISEIVEAI